MLLLGGLFYIGHKQEQERARVEKLREQARRAEWRRRRIEEAEALYERQRASILARLPVLPEGVERLTVAIPRPERTERFRAARDLTAHLGWENSEFLVWGMYSPETAEQLAARAAAA